MSDTRAQVRKFVEDTRSYRQILEELDIKAKEYAQNIEAGRIDGNILFQLELLQEKINGILYDYYLGDVERDYLNGVIDEIERDKLIDSRIGKGSYEKKGPYFKFGYDTSEFMENFEYIYE